MAETQHDETDPYLDSFEVAKMIGVAYNTVRYYLQQARANRSLGVLKAADLPEPDRFFGRSPVWRRSTIEAWVKARPGRGVGGGRPRGSRNTPRG